MAVLHYGVLSLHFCCSVINFVIGMLLWAWWNVSINLLDIDSMLWNASWFAIEDVNLSACTFMPFSNEKRKLKPWFPPKSLDNVFKPADCIQHLGFGCNTCFSLQTGKQT
jgi:hypothetical protein